MATKNLLFGAWLYNCREIVYLWIPDRQPIGHTQGGLPIPDEPGYTKSVSGARH